MTEFREHDLTGARFERVSLRAATFTKVYFNDAELPAVDVSGARIRGALFTGSRLHGVELDDVEITDEQLTSEVVRTEPGWPQSESFPFQECLRIVLNEEWEHRLYAERDLAVLEKEG